MKSCDVTHEIIESVSGYLSCAVKVDAVELLHDVNVIGYLKIGNNGLAKFLYFYVLAVVLADGN